MDTLQSVRTTLSAISNNTQPSARLKSDWKSRRRKKTSCLNTWQGAEGSCCPNLMLQASAWTLLSDLGSGVGDRSQNAKFGPSGKNHGVQHNYSALNLNSVSRIWGQVRNPYCELVTSSTYSHWRLSKLYASRAHRYLIKLSKWWLYLTMWEPLPKKKEKITSQPKALTSLCVKSCMGKSSRAPASIPRGGEKCWVLHAARGGVRTQHRLFTGK